MLRGCLFALLLYAGIAVGYFFWLDTVFDRPGSYYGAAALGFVVFCCLGALMNARTAWKDWSLASYARHQFPPRDGQLFAAAGPIQPINQPLLAPFSNTPCCLCEYDLSTAQPSTDSSEGKPGSDLAGFLMVPSEIQTGTGSIKLLGFPILEEGESYTLRSYTAARRARDFVTRTQFEDISGLRLLNAFGAIEDAWTDDDGSVEKNLQLKKVDPQKLFPDDLEAVWQEIHGEKAAEDPATGISNGDLADEEDELERQQLEDKDFEDENLEDHDLDDEEDDLDDEEDDDDESGVSTPIPNIPLPTLKENRVSPGDQVVVIGKFDEMRRGILPVGSGMKAIRLIRGDVDTLERKARSSLWSHLFGGLLFLVIAHAATCLVMYLYLNSESQVRKFSSQAFEAVEQGDVARLQKMQTRKTLDLNARRVNVYNRTLLMFAKDAATAQWLIDQKVPLNEVDDEGNTALSLAVSQGHADVAKALIAAKADLNLGGKSGETPLITADKRSDGTSLELAKLLREAGAKDYIVNEQNGQPLPADGGEQMAAINAYLQALRDHDAPALYSLMTFGGSGDVSAEIWDNWNLTIPKKVESFSGYTTDEAATVIVLGTWGDNDSPSKSTFNLVRVNGQWKIARNEIAIN
ncbi:ankyrin repeat domain-containing protein [Anatilimnocola sp. NA78]|uniref:ankyrin repeat domain-containing protein n=1 Tax=Anatilimnocola sp. NA78 TaxID=3415683 RepID=UPI003CE54A1E